MKRLHRILLAALLVGVTPLAMAAQPTDPTPPTGGPGTGGTTTPTTPTTPGTTASPTDKTPLTAPTDAEIAHITVTANTLDMDAGKLAQKRTKTPGVKTFAQRMIDDHTALNKQATELTERVQITPADNAMSQMMKKDHEAALATLKGLEGEAFDKAYVGHEVTYHAMVLDTIDRVLLPNAKNTELKDLLTGARPMISAHLEHAKLLQQQLELGTTAPAMTH